MKSSLVLGLLAVMFCSCQKELDPLGPTNRVDSTTADVSGKLKRWTNIYGGGIAQVDSFEYDASNRLVTWTVFYEDSTQANILVDVSTMRFQYSGSNDFPATCFYSASGGRTKLDTTYYFYDAANRLIKEELSGPGVKERYDYSYTNGMMVNNIHVLLPTIDAYVDSFFFDTNGNVTKRTTNTNSNSYASISLYDTKNSLLKNINVFKYINTAGSDENQLIEARSPANPITNTYADLSLGMLLQKDVVAYDYSSNGYPVKGTGTYTDASSVPVTNTPYSSIMEYY